MKNQDFGILIHIKHTYMHVHKHSATKIIAKNHHNSFHQNKDKCSERALLSFEALCSNTQKSQSTVIHKTQENLHGIIVEADYYVFEMQTLTVIQYSQAYISSMAYLWFYILVGFRQKSKSLSHDNIRKHQNNHII